MDVNIRLAALDDAQGMTEVLTRSWVAAYSGIIPDEIIAEKNSTRLDQFKEILTADNINHYVVLANGDIVGLLSVGKCQDEDADDSFLEVGRLYIHPDYFRRGIGTAAMEFACDLARSLNKTVVILWVLAENTSSIMFYEKCGFVSDGKTKPLIYGRTLECIRMRKDLAI